MAYNYGNIRTLLIEGFGEADLRRLIQYTDAFRDLRHELSSRDSLANIADKLIDFSERNLMLDPLLALVQEQNPRRYQLHSPYTSQGDPQMPQNLPELSQEPAKSASDVGQKLDQIIKLVQQGVVNVTVFNQQGQTVHGDQNNVAGNANIQKQGDTTHNHGDTTTIGDNNQNINLKSTLTNVTQSIGQIPQADDGTKQKLETLMKQLIEELEKATPETAEDAELMAEDAQTLIELAAAPNPNQKKVKRTANNLKQAAEDIQEAMPTVLGIALNIVNTVLKLPQFLV